jgi:RimJ/RimL family protein N-acetyltransferase
MNPIRYSAKEKLRNGAEITIRSICHEDGGALLDAFQGLDRESVYRRFFTPKKELSQNEANAMTDVDFRQVVALVVTVSGGGDALIGGGRYAMIDGKTAEIAFVTGGNYRGLGVASLVLKHLALIARANGLRLFHAEVLADNKPMLAVFKRSGMPMHTQREGTIFLVSLELGEPRAS